MNYLWWKVEWKITVANEFRLLFSFISFFCTCPFGSFFSSCTPFLILNTNSFCLFQNDTHFRTIGSVSTVLMPGGEFEVLSDEEPEEEELQTRDPTCKNRRTPVGSPARRGSNNALPNPGIIGSYPEDLTCGCGKSFPDICQLYYHQLDLQHFKTKRCLLCEKDFSKMSNFKRHNESYHSLKRTQHACGLCNKTFLRFDNLQEHQLKKHSLIVCRSCDVTCESRQELKMHVKLVHRNAKNLTPDKRD